ncbi:hypothetical protein CBOM_03127 [Ceraceosorus bombacis]|uniref:Uncharacterized protein n=1 Tax=Ceraceosorus bombacis TaxID=401625 RepID=A0A0P1BKW4_9BASI|nr:hypothetical protein CBOM_03127 [Ceraceosorus bombacis]
MGLGKARSPSPASKAFPDVVQGDAASVPRSFSSATSGNAKGRSASVVNFGSMSGASSISSGSQAMTQTPSAGSNAGNGPSIQRHSSHQGAPPAGHRASRGHRVTHSAAVSTPHLNSLVSSNSRQGESDADVRLRQRVGSFNSGKRLASFGSKMSGHSGEGTIIDHEAPSADGRRPRRISMRPTDDKCVVA